MATTVAEAPATQHAMSVSSNGHVEAPDILISDPDLESIWEKVKHGERLSADDGVKISRDR